MTPARITAALEACELRARRWPSAGAPILAIYTRADSYLGMVAIRHGVLYAHAGRCPPARAERERIARLCAAVRPLAGRRPTTAIFGSLGFVLDEFGRLHMAILDDDAISGAYARRARSAVSQA